MLFFEHNFNVWDFFFQIPLKFLKFVVLEEFHFCSKESEYKEDLIALKDLVRSEASVVVDSFCVLIRLTCSTFLFQPSYIFISALTSPQNLFDKNFMKEMSPSKIAKLIAPPALDDVKVAVLPVSSLTLGTRFQISVGS